MRSGLGLLRDTPRARIQESFQRVQPLSDGAGVVYALRDWLTIARMHLPADKCWSHVCAAKPRNQHDRSLRRRPSGFRAYRATSFRRTRSDRAWCPSSLRVTTTIDSPITQGSTTSLTRTVMVRCVRLEAVMTAPKLVSESVQLSDVG